MLFLVDDSSSMRLAQDKPRTQLSGVHDQAEGRAPGSAQHSRRGHIVGHGRGRRLASPAATRPAASRGSSSTPPRGTCTATGLQAGATYISDIGGTRNYTGNLENVFTCIAALGETGCGFEHQFAAILRSLGADGRAAPAENQGFLRPDAYLAVIMITNEDDCSATPGVPLFDTGSNTTSCRSSARPRTSAAASSATCATAPAPLHPNRRPEQQRDRDGQLHQLQVERSRKAICSARWIWRTGSRRSRPIRARFSSRRSRGCRRPTR